MLVSCGCSNNIPQTGWLQTTELYCLPVLEARSPKSSCWQGRAPPKGSREESFLVSFSFWCLWAVRGVLWHVAASRRSLPLSSRGLLPCVSVCLCPNFLLPLKTTVTLDLEPILNQCGFILTNYFFKDTISPPKKGYLLRFQVDMNWGAGGHRSTRNPMSNDKPINSNKKTRVVWQALTWVFSVYFYSISFSQVHPVSMH